MTRPETWSGSHLTSGAATAALPQAPPERPFGVHFQVTAAPPAHLLPSGYPSQGPPDRNNPALTPLAIAAVGISTALTALLTTMLIARMAKVSWREVFRQRRTFDWRRLGIHLLASAGPVGLSIRATALIAPASTG